MPRILAFAPHRKKKVKLSCPVPPRRARVPGMAKGGTQNEEKRQDRGIGHGRWNESSLK